MHYALQGAAPEEHSETGAENALWVVNGARSGVGSTYLDYRFTTEACAHACFARM